MKFNHSSPLVLALLSTVCAQGQTFTVQVGAPPAASTPLVQHGDAWHYHKGTNAPGAGWQTISDVALDAGLWSVGNGGIGYSTDTPNEVSQCQTILGDMVNGYTTLYMRRSFEVVQAPDSTRHLLLTLDYDDGFVAYLDGIEIARDRARTAVNVEPPNTDTSSSNHESSRGTSTPVNPPTVFDLGPVADRLQPGTHTLAILGLNGAVNSSDFVMIADLAVAPTSTGVVAGPLLAVVKGNSVELSGTNTVPGSTRVTVNGADTVFNAGSGAWTRQQSLLPGHNRLIVEAVDASGAVLFTTNQTVVSEIVSTNLGSLGLTTVLSPSMGVIHVANSLTVPEGGSLTIEAGSVLLLAPGVNLRATTNASLIIQGTRENPVGLFTADGLTMWGEIAADGAGSILTVKGTETIGGAVKGRNGATCLLEDSYFHDYKNGSVPIGGCTTAHSMTVRRCHFRVYHETLWQNTPMAIEDCLFELANNPSSDALDFDGAPPGSYIRHCTFRHGPQSNTDAIDIGPFPSGPGSTNTLIEDNLMFDFPNDKGVSIGEGSYGIVVRNCLMYGNDSGVAVKDSPGGRPPCTANIINCTIVDNDYGFRCYNKSSPGSATDGGQVTNAYNNIVWGSRIALAEILNAGFVVIDHSDLMGIGAFPGGIQSGDGIFDADPLFLNPSRRDYRLADGSPAIGAGRNGATLGCKFPVGSPMAPSHPTISSIVSGNGSVKIGFWVDSEKNYTLEGSATAAPGSWTKITNVYRQMTPRYVEVSDAQAEAHRFYRLVTPAAP